MIGRDFMSVEEVSGLLGVSAREVVQLAREDRIPAVQDSKTWLFPRQEFQRWIAGAWRHTESAGRSGNNGDKSAYSIIESNDLDHYRAQPGNWNVQVSQLSKGVFRSHIRSILLPGMVVYDNCWGCPSLVQGQAPDQWLMLGGVVAPEQASLRWCGRKSDRQLFACTSGGKAIDFSTEEQAHDIVLLITPELLRQVAGAGALEIVQGTHHVDFGVPGGQLLDIALDLINHLESRTALLRQPAIAGRARSTVLRAVEECFSGVLPEDAGESLNFREGAVHTAMKHVWETSNPTSAWDMAQAAGVSQKTLELAFRQVLGTTPGKYLMLTRLNGAHHQLAKAENGRSSVTEVALNWGFSHIGRFSGGYRKLFGELPSETLARSHLG